MTDWLPFSEAPVGKAVVIYNAQNDQLTIGKLVFQNEGDAVPRLDTLTPIFWTPTHYFPLPPPIHPPAMAPAKVGITGHVPTVTGENLKVIPE